MLYSIVSKDLFLSSLQCFSCCTDGGVWDPCLWVNRLAWCPSTTRFLCCLFLCCCSLGTGPCSRSPGNWSCLVLVCSGCHSKAPYTKWLKQPYFLSVWRLEVQEQGVLAGLLSLEAFSLAWRCLFSLCDHSWPFLCVHTSPVCLPLIKTSATLA